LCRKVIPLVFEATLNPTFYTLKFFLQLLYVYITDKVYIMFVRGIANSRH